MPPPDRRPGPSWTPEQDATVRAHYRRWPVEVVAGAVGRAISAVRKRAIVLGVAKRRAWTAADDRRLALLWECPDSLRSIAAALRRTEKTTYWRVQQLGLALGPPQGYEYLTAAADRTGYETEQLRRILDWASVKIRPVRARPSRRRGAHTGTRRRMFFVEIDAVDEAIAKWHRTENVAAAARDRGIGGDVLRAWLRLAGVPDEKRARKQHWRVESAVIDRVVAERRKLVSFSEAARRVGIDRSTLRLRLVRAGWTPGGRRWLVDLEKVRAVVAAAPSRQARSTRSARRLAA